MFGEEGYPGDLWSDEAHPNTDGFTALAAEVVAHLPTLDGRPVILLGDSWGILGGDIAEDSITAARPDTEVINASVSGNRLGQMLARLDSDVLAYGPALVIHWSGMANDFSQNIPDSLIAGQARELVRRCWEVGARVMFVGPVEYSLRPGRAGVLNDLLKTVIIDGR